VLSLSGSVQRFVAAVNVPVDAVGNSITSDGRYLLVANDTGATVVSVARAVTGARGAVLGELAPPSNRSGDGSIEALASLDGRYAFVSNEGTADLSVFDLRGALAERFRGSSYIGSIPVGQAPVGLAISPNDRWLYSTSELARGGGRRQVDGTLSVISIARAQRDPAHAVVATVPAGCSPVRVILSADGSTVWVTARESDELLAFSATRLRSDPQRALLAAVRVGAAPVGLAFIDHGRQIVVADSNRFGLAGRSDLMVVNVAAALAHRPALIGWIRSGDFPREMAASPGGRVLLVGNYESETLEAVDLRSVP
jgi:DNA-binding beta-propeller fold protein YncE